LRRTRQKLSRGEDADYGRKSAEGQAARRRHRKAFRPCAKTVRAFAGPDSGRTPSRYCARACVPPSALRACGC